MKRKDVIYLPVKKLPPRKSLTNAQSEYWNSFKEETITFQNQILHIDFNPILPHEVALTTGRNIHIYNLNDLKIVKSLTRFSTTAYSGNYRNDGSLIVGGEDNGSVKIFDLQSRSVLREMKGHNKAVHVTRFSSDNRQIISASDDQTIIGWDLLSAKSVFKLEGHEDYVRCLDFRTDLPNVIISGSYDHTVKLWDIRSGEVTSTLEHKAPIENLLLIDPQQLVTLSGTEVNIWDIGTQKLTKTFSNHHKTVTCLTLLPRDPTNTEKTILTGSLDQRVSLSSLDTELTHSAEYTAPVLSLASSNEYIIVGLSDGNIICRGTNYPETPLIQKKPSSRVL